MRATVPVAGGSALRRCAPLLVAYGGEMAAYLVADKAVHALMEALDEVGVEAMQRWERLKGEWSALVHQRALLDSELRREHGNRAINAALNPALDEVVVDVERLANPELRELVQTQPTLASQLPRMPAPAKPARASYSAAEVEQLVKYFQRRQILSDSLSKVDRDLANVERAMKAAESEAMAHRAQLRRRCYGVPIRLEQPLHHPAGYAAAPGYGYAAAPHGYAAAPHGYGAAAHGYSAAPGGYGAAAHGYGAAAHGYSAAPGGYGAAPPSGVTYKEYESPHLA